MSVVHPLDKIIKDAIHQEVFPGASLLVQKKDEVIWYKVYGEAQIVPSHRSLTARSVFDVASLTKPVSTATLCMLAYQDGLLRLEDPLSRHFPVSGDKTNITVAQLLNHTSGLPAWKPYHIDLLKEHPSFMATDEGKDWLVGRILQESLENPVGQKTVYSDLGYILLGVILEKIYGQRLEILFQEKVAIPMGLVSTFFQSLDPKHRADIHAADSFVVTERCPWRRKILDGVVMDGTAYIMGGVAGHAGLFSTAPDLARWLHEIRWASRGEGKLIRQETFERFATVPDDRDPTKAFFTYGFDTRGIPSSTGDHFSLKTIGHLGFTGCSLWWDPLKDVSVIFLTNRVHPSRKNEKIRQFRPKLHNLIWESLGLL